ncbi:hypothetical protein QBZ16_000335 [Prototheca wickerhamii]|uniref:PH domain-containing protein n=1 Tax=Prototheca wickerhamii TaxID=3111 RepID=A0AAD9IPC3_PROWI|nr:hypothetical protein QBZ16_000335 [Prototheca wickerhamii]
MEGILYKRGDVVPTWRPRRFQFQPRPVPLLLYFKSDPDAPTGCLDLRRARVTRTQDGPEATRFVVQGAEGTVWYLMAPTPAVALAWLEALVPAASMLTELGNVRPSFQARRPVAEASTSSTEATEASPNYAATLPALGRGRPSTEAMMVALGAALPALSLAEQFERGSAFVEGPAAAGMPRAVLGLLQAWRRLASEEAERGGAGVESGTARAQAADGAPGRAPAPVPASTTGRSASAQALFLVLLTQARPDWCSWSEHGLLYLSPELACSMLRGAPTASALLDLNECLVFGTPTWARVFAALQGPALLLEALLLHTRLLLACADEDADARARFLAPARESLAAALQALHALIGSSVGMRACLRHAAFLPAVVTAATAARRHADLTHSLELALQMLARVCLFDEAGYRAALETARAPGADDAVPGPWDLIEDGEAAAPNKKVERSLQPAFQRAAIPSADASGRDGSSLATRDLDMPNPSLGMSQEPAPLNGRIAAALETSMTLPPPGRAARATTSDGGQSAREERETAEIIRTRLPLAALVLGVLEIQIGQGELDVDLLDHALRFLIVAVTSPEGDGQHNGRLRLEFVGQLLEGGLLKLLADLSEFDNGFLSMETQTLKARVPALQAAFFFWDKLPEARVDGTFWAGQAPAYAFLDLPSLEREFSAVQGRAPAPQAAGASPRPSPRRTALVAAALDAHVAAGGEAALEALADAERLALELGRVPRLAPRLRAAAAALRAPEALADVQGVLAAHAAAARELRESPVVRRLLAAVLALGNVLNHGGPPGRRARVPAAGAAQAAGHARRRTAAARCSAGSWRAGQPSRTGRRQRVRSAGTPRRTSSSLAIPTLADDLPALSSPLLRAPLAEAAEQLAVADRALAAARAEVHRARQAPDAAGELFLSAVGERVERLSADAQEALTRLEATREEVAAAAAYFGENAVAVKQSEQEFWGDVQTFVRAFSEQQRLQALSPAAKQGRGPRRQPRVTQARGLLSGLVQTHLLLN